MTADRAMRYSGRKVHIQANGGLTRCGLAIVQDTKRGPAKLMLNHCTFSDGGPDLDADCMNCLALEAEHRAEIQERLRDEISNSGDC